MIPTPLANASLTGILYYKSPSMDCSDRPVLLCFDIPILLRHCRRRLVPHRRLHDVDDVDLFLEDFTFVIDRTALCNLLTLGVFHSTQILMRMLVLSLLHFFPCCTLF